ncbi:MAG: restriction endonuclease subunit S [Caldilineaceae bacterium]|nr:restriction endonuclease subunit S [Caldilineaceae bacterium]
MSNRATADHTPDAAAFQETEIGPIPADWDVIPFPKTLRSVRPKVGKVQQRDYQSYGCYPVVDQSQTHIAGYTDDASLVYEGDLPVIIFGDHTRVFKFVDFKFVCGADGVKVLVPNIDIIEPTYYYFALSGLTIPNKGYNRHYKLLQEQLLPLPPLEEQRRIAAVLTAIQDAIAAQEDVIAAARAFKRSLMHRLFTYGPGRQPSATKETEIGEIPVHWEVVELGDCCSISTGTTPSTQRHDYYEGSNPFIKTAEVANTRIRQAETHISDAAIADYNLKVFPSGTILMAMYGQGKTRGQVSLLEIPASITQNAAAIVPDKSIMPVFLWQYLLGKYDDLRADGMRGHISHLNLSFVRAFKVPRPHTTEQKDIAIALESIDAKIAVEEDRLSALQALFKSMLHQLMTGQIRLRSDEGLPVAATDD